MNKKIIRECLKHGCSDAPYSSGLCKKHHEEAVRQEHRRKAALNALGTTLIEGRSPENQELREELFRLQKWWDEACNAVNYNKKDSVLGDAAGYAVEWCIALALEIVDSELAFRNGSSSPQSLEATRQCVWERFRKLEAGFRSNATSQPA